MYPRPMVLNLHLRAAKQIATLALLLACSVLLPAQNSPAKSSEKPFYLHDGDTVVFYGDSITEQHYYTQSVEDYVATRFPHMHIRFFNAGNGGDRVTGGGGGSIDERLARDVFPQKPTVVTIMLGMNDGGYGSLTPEVESKYTQGYEHILNSIQQSLPNARITLLGPSPYDEVSRPEIVSGGYNATLARFSEIDKELAAKHGATFIDLNAPFVDSLKRGIAINPLATELLVPDRVHPEPIAHWFMAEAILKGWNAPSIVSSTTIDARLHAATDTQNSQVTDVSSLPGHDTGIRWTELDGALPLPLDDKNIGHHFLHQISDIDHDLDQQLLTVQELTPGNYQLNIDGLPTGTFSSEELAHGINLADQSTPMRGQSYRASWYIRDREDTHYVRLRMLVNQMKTGSPAEPGATDLLRFEEDLQKQIYEIAQPLPHKYFLVPALVPKLVPTIAPAPIPH
jgi:lysophospholipase L1-like esterase